MSSNNSFLPCRMAFSVVLQDLGFSLCSADSSRKEQSPQGGPVQACGTLRNLTSTSYLCSGLRGFPKVRPRTTPRVS